MNSNLQEFLKSSNGRMLLGQIISMLRGIHFVHSAKSIEEAQRLRDQGYVKRSSFMLDITPQHWLSISLGWKRKSYELQEFIAEKFLLFFDELANGDREAFCDVIKSTIQNSLLDNQIFDLNCALGIQESLYDDNDSLFSILSSRNPTESASHLFIKFYSQMKNSLADWLVIYPMQNISSQSFQLGFDGISLYNPKDESLWGKICSNYENAKLWHPSESQSLEPRKGGIKEPLYNFTIFPNSIWLICESNGTSDGARNNASIKMKTFVSVLFSCLFPHQNLLDKSSARSETYSKQFSSDNNRTGFIEVNASIGEIIPPMLGEITITEEDFNKVRDWYSKKNSFQEEKKRRVQVASQFLHYGIVAENLERFIHFFIVLDSLFGERNRVEAKITEGIKQIFPNNEMWEYKISRLFDLRSELVHGGCSSISEWEELDAYRRHTKSHPLYDVTVAAMTAFQNI